MFWRTCLSVDLLRRSQGVLLKQILRIVRCVTGQAGFSWVDFPPSNSNHSALWSRPWLTASLRPRRDPLLTQQSQAEASVVWGSVRPTSFGSLRKDLFPIRWPGSRAQADTNSRESFKNTTTSGRCSGKTLGTQRNNWGLLLASPAKARVRQVWSRCFFLPLFYLQAHKATPGFWCHDAQ